MKQHYCLLERFNNYFNRKIIKYESLSDYEDHAKDSFIPYNEEGSMTLFDFNPADNVTTEIIVNNVPFDPDYFLLLDDNAQIVQRWFVLEQKRNRQGQWVYYLRRDVVADNFNNLLNAPIFVQKGMLHDDDPFIFNSEGMSFNQIKKSETLLKDKSKTAWIICYLAKSLNSANINLNIASEEVIPEFYTIADIASDLGLPESIVIQALNFDGTATNGLQMTEKIKIKYRNVALNPSGQSRQANFEFSGALDDVTNKYWDTAGSYTDYLFTNNGLFQLDPFSDAVINKRESLIGVMPNVLSRDYYLPETLSLIAVMNKYLGKVILYLGNYYTFGFNIGALQSTSVRLAPRNYNAWDEVCELTQQNSSGGTNIYIRNGEADLIADEKKLDLQMTVYTPATRSYKAKISSARNVCYDQEFDIVAMPFSKLNVSTSGGDFVSENDISQKVASALAVKEGTNIYDVQLLPYCPRPDLISADNSINLDNLLEDSDYNFITYDNAGTDTNVGIILYLKQASFSTIIEHSLTIKNSVKIDSECDFYRLASPNYQGVFEFNVAKNGGNVEFFKAYCTYKPYTPFIKVTPNFNYLYGEDYNDNRGLICGGDFSLPRSSSAWQQYQLENKNYQNIFNREIQNMNFMQSIEMRNQLISGAVGVVSDTAKGAGAGAFVGGGAGAVVGGALGAITSGIGFTVDTDTLARTQREQRQLAIDKFNYQLGNIKALPYTLTKVGAFDISSKIFPFLEYYTCTDKEKDALREKIKYESMTVMRIGTINEFKDFDGKKNYFKGELIRNDEIADDSHILNAIYEELLKGVYI